MHRTRGLVLLLAALTLAVTAIAQQPDLTKEPTLYVVGYAHLDTEWRWEYPQTIDEFLPRTMHDNFALFAKYPHYVFNFSGANRYRLMKEYYPADFRKLQEFVKSGQWFPSGSSMEEGDVNSPSAESIVRQILYGTHFFRRELGRTSAEYMLPDCFGFPASLPSILAHMGIRGFSTQKLTWGSSAPVGGDDSPERTPPGTPFNVGIWEGPDGKSVIAAFNPGSYSGGVSYDLSTSDPSNKTRGYIDWPARVARDGEVSGVFADYHYYGTGDVGGAPAESSVALVEKIVSSTGERGKTGGDGSGSLPLAARHNPLAGQQLHVLSATADQMFLDIQRDQTARLPRYRGDLELTNHSAGSLTSEAMQKRWNHDNELLADAAEKAAVGAMLLGRPYPQERLNDAWTLVMGGQFHDIAAGTATPKAYEYSWNDDVIAMNQFTAVRNSAVQTIASTLDTRTSGTPVVVYNPLNVAREDVVDVPFDGDGDVHVVGPDGVTVPAQRRGKNVLFLANVPSVGFAVYDVQHAATTNTRTTLKVSESSLENARYRVAIDAHGDIGSIHDKKLDKELLSAPLRLAFQTENPHDWPAWNMDWADQKQPPRGFVSGPAQVRVVERGPVRAAVEITRDSESSHFVQTVSLSEGDAGNRIEIANAIDWKTSAAALKATFPLTASNPQATYNWEVGTIERGNDNEKEFEVPSHEWIDLTDAHGGGYGVTLLTGAKYGSDKPDDATLRLTLLYTPGLGSGNGRSYDDQTSQDWGHHEFTYGLASHGADRGGEGTDWQALRLSDPLVAFAVPKHAGTRGRTLSLLQVSNPRVRVLALKKAEESDEIVVRAVNLDPQPQWAHFTFAQPVAKGRAVNGQELTIGPAEANDGTLLAQFEPFGIRSFALKLAPSAQTATAPRTQPVTLTFDRNVATHDGEKSDGGFDAQGRALPAEMLPPQITYGDVVFDVTGKAVTAHGQTIALPPGFTHVHVLAASAEGDRQATFRLGDHAAELTIHAWNGYLGQWDTRLWRKQEEELPPRPDAPLNAPPRKRMATVFAGLTPGCIKHAPLAWYASHHHDADGKNVAYAYSYLFAYTLDVPPGATTLALPNDERVRVMAVSVTE
jgi:alpha-mannosidase